MELYSLFGWIEALSSCAIEGNKTAQEILELSRTNPNEFLKRIIELEESRKKEDADASGS